MVKNSESLLMRSGIDRMIQNLNGVNSLPAEIESESMVLRDYRSVNCIPGSGKKPDRATNEITLLIPAFHAAHRENKIVRYL